MNALMNFETEGAAGRMPRFRYYVVLQEAIVAFGVIFFIGMSAAAVYARLTRGKPGDGLWAASLAFLFLAWACFSVLKFFFKRHREIVVNDEGVMALAFGRIWRSIRWTDIARIERVRRPMVTIWNTWRDGYEFVFYGPRSEEIHFVDEITNEAALLTLLDGYVAQYRIPMVAFDRGSDTRAKIRATTLDRAERKRLLRQGYQTTLTSLSAR